MKGERQNQARRRLSSVDPQCLQNNLNCLSTLFLSKIGIFRVFVYKMRRDLVKVSCQRAVFWQFKTKQKGAKFQRLIQIMLLCKCSKIRLFLNNFETLWVETNNFFLSQFSLKSVLPQSYMYLKMYYNCNNCHINISVSAMAEFSSQNAVV